MVVHNLADTLADSILSANSGGVKYLKAPPFVKLTSLNLTESIYDVSELGYTFKLKISERKSSQMASGYLGI